MKRLFDIARLMAENCRLRLSIARALHALDNDNPDLAVRVLEDAVRQ